MLVAAGAVSAAPVLPYLPFGPVAPAAVAAGAPPLKVLTVNVSFGQFSPRRLLEIVREAGPDVLVLQELTPHAETGNLPPQERPWMQASAREWPAAQIQ